MRWCSSPGFCCWYRAPRPASISGCRYCATSCRWWCWNCRTWPVSVIGLALLILARALFRRLAAAYQLTVWLLAAGMVTSLLRGSGDRAGAAARPGAAGAVAGPARVLPPGADPRAALHPGVDREPCDRDFNRVMDRILRQPARRLFALAVVDVCVRGRRATHAARLAGGGSAGGGIPGNEPAAPGTARAGCRLAGGSHARAQP